MLKRTILTALGAWSKSRDRKPLVLRGARQVGKTLSLKDFGKTKYAATHYLNFERDGLLASIFEESLEPQKILDRIARKLNSVINLEKDLIIFDEVQLCPPALTCLKYFAEERKEASIIAAGSLLGITLAGFGEQKVSFPVGQVDFLEMYPLSFAEFLEAAGNKQLYDYFLSLKIGDRVDSVSHNLLFEIWKQYISTGGLPEAVAKFFADPHHFQGDAPLLEVLNQVRQIQENILTAYEADIAKHSGKLNALHIIRVLQSIPSKLAASQEQTTTKFTFKDVIPGVYGYERMANCIDWLVASGIVYKLKIANTAQSPILGFCQENVFKLFLFDLGLLGALSKLDINAYRDFSFGMYKGYIAENFVLQELIQSGLPSPVSWASNTSEVEFVIDLKGELVPVEVKSATQTRAKSLSVYISKYKPSKVIILSANQGSVSKKDSATRIDAPIYMAGKLRELA